MREDAAALLEDLLRQVNIDLENLRAQTAGCMGDVRVVNALLDVQMAYSEIPGVIEAALEAVK